LSSTYEPHSQSRAGTLSGAIQTLHEVLIQVLRIEVRTVISSSARITTSRGKSIQWNRFFCSGMSLDGDTDNIEGYTCMSGPSLTSVFFLLCLLGLQVIIFDFKLLKYILNLSSF